MVRSHGLVPSSGTWQRGSIFCASCRDVFRACISRRQAPAITDLRALSQGSIWFSKGSRSLQTASSSVQVSALCRTGEAGWGGISHAGYLNWALSRSIYWTVRVSGHVTSHDNCSSQGTRYTLTPHVHFPPSPLPLLLDSFLCSPPCQAIGQFRLLPSTFLQMWVDGQLMGRLC